MPASSRIRIARIAELPAIAELAREIWWLYYPGIISPDQINYMLERMYSLEQLQLELKQDRVTYFSAWDGEQIQGFASVGPAENPREHKLHKLYVHPRCQRSGHGTRLLNAAVTHARSRHAASMILCVNKRNTQALAAYQAWGFQVREEVCVEIGGGFVMDDYVLYRNLGP